MMIYISENTDISLRMQIYPPAGLVGLLNF